MAEEMRPASKQDAPDPSDSYERSHPEHESGMGRLDNNNAVPTDRPDQMDDAVHNKQNPEHQINAEELTNDRADNKLRPPEAVDHSMHDEEPTGWDQAPQAIEDAKAKRHSRTGGKGGTPNEGEARRNG